MGLDLLCINAGSSSLKFAVFRIDGAAEEKLLSGAVEEIGETEGRFRLDGADGGSLIDGTDVFPTQEKAAETMLHVLEERGMRDFAAAGHRMVHGGPDFFAPQLVDNQLRSRLRELIPFAPLHMPSQLAMIEGVAKHWPNLAQVVCFDTAFHRPIPELARRFALPRELFDRGVYRYGFHGLSYEFVVGALKESLGQRAIIAHLGNGASMVALKQGVPIDTSMALTPAAGFMMSTRSGDLDPGILLFLLRQGWTPEKLASMIERQSGLAGVSAGIGDMKILLSKRKEDPRCDLAIEMFCYQIRKFIGAYAAALNGLDTLVFTGGIGERAPEVREGVCRGLEFLGIGLSADENRANAEIISDGGKPCVVRVVHTDEDVMIARHTRDVLRKAN